MAGALSDSMALSFATMSVPAADCDGPGLQPSL